MHRLTSLLGLLLLAALPSPCFALYFADDFNASPAGSVLGSPWVLNVPHSDMTLEYRITADGTDLFGHGAGNRFLALTDSISGPPNIQFAAFFDVPSLAGRVSFRFHDPNLTDSSGNSTGLQLRLGTSGVGSAGNTTSAFGIFLHNGGVFTNTPGAVTFDKRKPLASYSFAASHTLTLLFNNGTDALSYDNGSRHVLAPGTMHLWLDGVLIATDLGRFNNHDQSNPLANLTINGPSSGSFFVMYLDDVLIQSL